MSKNNVEMEEPSWWKNNGVLYVEVKVNRQPSMTLVNMSATHNFMNVGEAENLELKVKRDKGGQRRSI